jgi:alanine racemase
MEVDLHAVERNAQRLAARAGVPLIAMLKADAYGVGAVECAHVLQHAANIWALGVATVAEGRVLRDAGITARLFCCTPVLKEELLSMHRLNITPSLFRESDILAWNAIGDGVKRAPWHLLIDTGLNRAGVQWNDAASLRALVAQFPPEGAFTHFYASELHESSRALQESRFALALRACEVLRVNPAVLLHTDNSLGIAARARSPYHLARPGIALHGWPASSDIGLEPVVTLRARVVDVRLVPSGESVSYGATWIAQTDSRVATISIGYADGYRRAFSNTASVVINGTRCPVVGTVTMDMIMADVSTVHCEVGDTATLIGLTAHDGITLEQVALAGDISPYELLVGLKLRLERVYMGQKRAELLADADDTEPLT